MGKGDGETMHKSEFVAFLAKDAHLSKKDSAEYLKVVLSGIEHALESSDRIILTGFGSFEMRSMGARKVRGIRGGMQMVEAHSKVAFSVGAGLKGVAAMRGTGEADVSEAS